MNRQHAHYHPNLNEPCAHGAPEPRWPLLTIVGGVIGLLCFGVVLWWLVTAL